MQRLEDKLTASVASALTALGYELVGVEYLAQGRHSVLRVFIDSEQGVTLDDCERASRQISAVLDVDDPIRGQYNLEVSSPGLDRPLFSAEHFARFVGHKVKLRLRHAFEGQRKFKGVIEGVENERIHITLDDGRLLELELGEIEKANLVPEF